MQKAEIDRLTLIVLKGVLIIITGLTVFFGIKVAFTYFLPAVLAAIFSMFLEPLVRVFLKLKCNRLFATIFSMIIFLGIITAMTIFGISRMVQELTIFYQNIPVYSKEIYQSVTRLIELGKDIYLQLTPEALTIIEQSVGSLFEKLTTLLSSLTTGLINAITLLPGLLIFSLITLIATFFITKDKPMIKAFLLRQFNDTWQTKVVNLKDSLFVALLGFVKAQLIFITVTFFESFVGLTLIGVPYAFILAILIACVDILPVLGTGSIYVPWAIVNFVNGDFKMGISLLILWGIIFIVRYMIEPKVYGHQLGIHPLLALLSLFAGLKLIGVAGLILGPAAVVVVIACQKAGILPSFK